MSSIKIISLTIFLIYAISWTLFLNSDAKRILTTAEEDIANSARQTIVKALTKNLIRLFAAITIEENRQSRQGFPIIGGGPPLQQQEPEEEDEDVETATFNPHTLPQVAALLGAIFSGHLNLTNVVDRAFYLVPDTVRTQVSGLFNLLGGNGQYGELPTTTSSSGHVLLTTSEPIPSEIYIPHPLDTTTVQTNLTEISTGSSNADLPLAFGSVFETIESKKTDTETKPTTPKTDKLPQPILPIVAEGVSFDEDEYEDHVDDENDEEYEASLKKAEQDIVDLAKLFQPESSDKEARFFLGSVRQIFRSDSGFNLTTIFRSLPDLFKGARKAYQILERLGEIVTGED